MININFKSIHDLMAAFPDEQSCIDHLERLRWNGKVESPFDPLSKVYKCKDNKYFCKNTGKYFNVKTYTLYDSSKVPLTKWFLAIYLATSHKKGISSHQLARDLDVTQKTAWFMLQRIRKCFEMDCDECLDNDVEADETYIGGENSNRHKDKKVKGSQGRSTKDKTPVFGMVERDGKLVAKVVKNTGSKILTAEIIKAVKKTATIITDEWTGYCNIKKHFEHLFVNHGKGEYVFGDAYTNTLEGFWSLLKRGILGIYHSLSKKHLQLYIDEFVFRYNTRENSTCDRFNLFLCNMQNRTSYKELINNSQI